MGGELVKASLFFYKCYPYYKSIGMSPDEFWNGHSYLTVLFREADKIERERKNQELWLQGLYFYEALCKASPLLRAFSEATEPIPYSDEPYPITEEALKAKQERDRQKMYEDTKETIKAWVGAE